ncbi:MAG: class I SAM-dependent methyltransferase [Gammaproteobacteria bacterium]
MIDPEIRQQTLQGLQGALVLNIAYIGVVNGLFDALAEHGTATASALAGHSGKDPGYVTRWCDSAYAFELLEEPQPGIFRLTPLGKAFRPGVPGTLMPVAVQAVLSTHLAERAAGLMSTGERPGERVLAERETVLPWFGPMLEHQFGPLLDREVLNSVPVFREVDERGGLAVDLGCGNGWYLRRLAGRFPKLRGIGLDGFEENIHQAQRLARAEGVADRLRFEAGDIHHFNIDQPVDLIAMNRALHHVWDRKESVFGTLKAHLKPGGFAVIWEPDWPAERIHLRDPMRRAMAFQNLGEHVQGNHFLCAEDIAEQFRQVGMEPAVYPVAEGRDVIVVGRRPL